MADPTVSHVLLIFMVPDNVQMPLMITLRGRHTTVRLGVFFRETNV